MTDTTTDATDDEPADEPYPENDDGTYDYEQMLDEMGIETSGHPTLGWPHRLNGELVEVHDVRYGELQLESRDYGTYERPVTELYDDWRNDDLTVTPVSMRGVADDETVIPTNALSTLVAYLDAESGLPSEVRTAVETVRERIGDEDLDHSVSRTYGLFGGEPQDPHTIYTLIGDPVEVDPTGLSHKELYETVRDRALSENDVPFEVPERDVFIAEVGDFPVNGP